MRFYGFHDVLGFQNCFFENKIDFFLNCKFFSFEIYTFDFDFEKFKIVLPDGRMSSFSSVRLKIPTNSRLSFLETSAISPRASERSRLRRRRRATPRFRFLRRLPRTAQTSATPSRSSLVFTF